MNRLFKEAVIFTALGVMLLCCYAPWTQSSPDSPDSHPIVGYAPIWSSAYAQLPGARIETGAFATYAGGILFFAVIVAAIFYFFREKRGKFHDEHHRHKN